MCCVSTQVTCGCDSISVSDTRLCRAAPQCLLLNVNCLTTYGLIVALRFAASVWHGDKDSAEVGINDDEIFLRLQDLIAEALADGLSVQGALNALSLGAVRLYLRNDIGNPFDVHFLTGIASRRVVSSQAISTII